MENDEIIESYFYDDDLDHSYIDAEDFQSLMDKARQDEREKMQGVDFWISWSKHYNWKENARISLKEPTVAAIGMEGAKIYNVEEPYSCLSDEICTALNISPGQCKKFRIVEEL